MSSPEQQNSPLTCLGKSGCGCYVSLVTISMQNNLENLLLPSRDNDDQRILQSDWTRAHFGQ